MGVRGKREREKYPPLGGPKRTRSIALSLSFCLCWLSVTPSRDCSIPLVLFASLWGEGAVTVELLIKGHAGTVLSMKSSPFQDIYYTEA